MARSDATWKLDLGVLDIEPRLYASDTLPRVVAGRCSDRAFDPTHAMTLIAQSVAHLRDIATDCAAEFQNKIGRLVGHFTPSTVGQTATRSNRRSIRSSRSSTRSTRSARFA
jgi:hypothetical protein